MSAAEIDLLADTALLDGVDSRHLTALTAVAESREYGEGDRIIVQDAPADALFFLRHGEIRVTFSPTSPHSFDAGSRTWPVGHELTYVTRRPGHPIGWSSIVEPHRYRATATALRPTTMTSLSRRHVDDYCDAHPDFAVELARRALWLAGSRLLTARARVLAGRYAGQRQTIAALLAEHAGSLPVTSPLHRVPHLLESRLTLDDAIDTVDTVAADATGMQREIAVVIVELLHEIRAEVTLFSRLRAIYELVASASADMPTAELRRQSLVAFAALFADTRHVIHGRERLPAGAGHIFVMNHLVNHPDNLLPNDFILTLDTHFVASMIVLPRYGDAPVRVIRRAEPHEQGHQRFFDRLGYVYVDSGPCDTDRGRADPDATRRDFLDSARAHLAEKRNLVICPEGTSVPTADSPVALRAGAFRLALDSRPEPLIVPIGVANFDRKLTATRTCAVIGEPIRMSEHVPRDAPAGQLHHFVNCHVHSELAALVRRAREAASPPDKEMR